MRLETRIKRIVSLTADDFYNQGYSTNETPKELKIWLYDALMQDVGIEDAPTYAIALKVYEMLHIVDVIDLELIHSIVFKELKQTSEGGAR